MKFSKRITALSLSAALLLNTPAITILASADNTASKVYTYDGYTVEYFVRSEWQGNQNIEVKITNTGTEPITYWSVGYEAGGEISGLWNAQVLGHQGTEYILCGAGYNNEINPNESIHFGYTLSSESFKIPQNIVNCAKRVDITDGYNIYYNITGDYGATYQAEMIIENLSDEDISAWSLSFDGNASIDNLWNGKLFENADYHFSVRGDNNTVISANDSVAFNFAGTKSEEWNTDEDNTYEITFENYHLSGIVVSMEYGFEEEIDPELDTDGDGLPDYIEKEIGSDRYKSDTDDDGLPDGYEFYRVGTDPTKVDTDDNGISDADEDADDDGLTNIEEYSLGTNPAYYDTDYDGLSDYDELNKYNTDPLVFDTDGDKVSDGDEVTLGLDPKNPATFGYPDNEYTTQQTVSEDDPALQAINSIEDNPFTISVDITAAGVAENNLSSGESGYSYHILQNDAVLGVIPELSYSEGLSVTDVVIKFNLDDSAVNSDEADIPDDLKGINKYIIFKYFEDTNMLLPIETTYDTTTNSISTHVDEVGTYCVMDVNKWFSNMESVPAGNYYDDEDNEPANIVFCLDTRGIIGESTLDQLKKDIREISEDAFDRYSDIKLYVYYQQFGSNFKVANNLLSSSEKNYFESYEELESALDNLTTYTTKNKYWAYDYVAATQYMIDTCDENIIAMYHFVADERVMGSVTGVKKLMTEIQNSIYKTSEGEDINRIHVSTICLNSDKTFDSESYIYKIAEMSGGIVDTVSEIDIENSVQIETVTLAFNSGATTYNKVKASICTILGEGNEGVYNVISSTGLTPIKLDGILSSDPENEIDSDRDGLSDWKEVNTTLIFSMYGKHNNYVTNRITAHSLPTVADCKDYYANSGLEYPKAYVAQGYDLLVKTKAYSYEYKGNIQAAEDYINTLHILPIVSSPVETDGDNDGLIDKYDLSKLNANEVLPTNDSDEKVQFAMALKYDSSFYFTIKDSDGNNDDFFHLFSTPFYNDEIKYDEIYNEQYGDFNITPGTKIKATFLIISRGNEETYTDAKGNLQKCRRIKYWVKTKINEKYGYIPFDILDYDITAELIRRSKINRNNLEEPVYFRYSNWYYPLPDTVGVYNKIHMLTQIPDACSATCHAMAINYYKSIGKIDIKDIDLNSLDVTFNDSTKKISLWNGLATWNQVDKLQFNNIDCNIFIDDIPADNAKLIGENNVDKSKDLLNILKEELQKNNPVIIGADKDSYGNHHFVLVVSYCGKGDELSDFIIIDPFSEMDSNGTFIDKYWASYYKLNSYFKQYYNYYMHTYSNGKFWYQNSYWVKRFEIK